MDARRWQAGFCGRSVQADRKRATWKKYVIQHSRKPSQLQVHREMRPAARLSSSSPVSFLPSGAVSVAVGLCAVETSPNEIKLCKVEPSIFTLRLVTQRGVHPTTHASNSPIDMDRETKASHTLSDHIPNRGCLLRWFICEGEIDFFGLLEIL